MREKHHLMQFFEPGEGAPAHHKGLIKPFEAVAKAILSNLPDNSEKEEAFKHLIACKEAALRADIYRKGG